MIQVKLESNLAKGMTLIELILVIAVIAVIATIAVPSYREYIDKTDNALAIADITTIRSVLERYYLENHRYPANLNEVQASLPSNGKDPWGNNYFYLNLADAKGLGGARADKRLNPINTQYDLFSMGKDGQTKKQVSHKNSLDDIILARDGRFIGMAADF